MEELDGKVDHPLALRYSTGRRRWTEATFFEVLTARSADEAAIAKRLLDWAVPRFTWIRWGRGKVHGSFTPMVVKGRRDSFFTVYTNGRIELRFGKLVEMPPFDDAGEREALRASLDQVPGFDVPVGAADLWPNVPLGPGRGEPEPRLAMPLDLVGLLGRRPVDPLH